MTNWLLGGVALIGAVTLVPSLASLWLRRSTRSRVLDRPEDLPSRGSIVVLGCPPLGQGGRPNRFLLGRVEAALAAHRARPTLCVICTGRGGPPGTGEAEALARGLIAGGVPEDSITLDTASRRTIDSVAHLARIGAPAPLLLVSQTYHLPRALFLAHHAGLDARGWPAHAPRPGRRILLREVLGRLRAILETRLVARSSRG